MAEKIMGTNTVRRLLGATAIGAALAAGALGGVASAHADATDPSTDQAYLATLSADDITYSSPEFAIAIGHAICTDLHNGWTVAGESVELWSKTGLNTVDDAAWYVGAAIGAYCPEIPA